MKNIESNTINIKQNNLIPVATFTQEDNATLTLELYKDGQAVDLTGQTVTLGVERQDGAIIEQTDDINASGNIVTINLKKNILACNGLAKAQLTITDINGVMSTSVFYFKVDRKILGIESIEASNDIKTINSLVLELKTNVTKAIEDTKSKADNLLNGLQETGDNLTSTVKATTDKLVADTKVEVNNIVEDYSNIKKDYSVNIKKDYETLKKAITDENIGIKLQNDVTALQNGLKSNQALAYTGSSIDANNTLDGRTENMKIYGRTLQNLFVQENYYKNPNDSKEFFYGSKYKKLFGSGKYTLKNTTGKTLVWDISREDNDTWIRSVISNKSVVIELEEGQDVRNIQAIAQNGWELDENTRGILENNVIILKGDKLDIIDSIDYFEGIKSFGEAEGNKISILSNGKNLFDMQKIKQGSSINFTNERGIISGAFTGQYKATASAKISVTQKTKVLIKANLKGCRLVIKDCWNESGEFKAIIDTNNWGNNLNDFQIGQRIAYVDKNSSIRVENPHNTPVDFVAKDICCYKIDGTESQPYELYKQDKKDILLKEPLRSVGDIADLLYEEDGKVKVERKIGTRAYQQGDESNPNVITDKKNTCYVLTTPVTEIVENCFDVDLDTYQDKTYFNIENNIQGTIDFKVPSNIGSIVQANAREINNLWDVINSTVLPGMADLVDKLIKAGMKLA